MVEAAIRSSSKECIRISIENQMKGDFSAGYHYNYEKINQKITSEKTNFQKNRTDTARILEVIVKNKF